MQRRPAKVPLTSLKESPRDICSCSSFCSSFRAPMDCWFRAKSDSSFSPASVKYFEKCSQLRLLAGKSSYEKRKSCAKLHPDTRPLTSEGRGSRNWSKERNSTHHQPVVHADLAETDCDRVDVLLVYPRLEQLHSKRCRNTCRRCTHTSQGKGGEVV